MIEGWPVWWMRPWVSRKTQRCWRHSMAVVLVQLRGSTRYPRSRAVGVSVCSMRSMQLGQAAMASAGLLSGRGAAPRRRLKRAACW